MSEVIYNLWYSVHMLSYSLSRRNVTPASFEVEGERNIPRRMALKQFEMPLGGVANKEGICSIVYI